MSLLDAGRLHLGATRRMPLDALAQVDAEVATAPISGKVGFVAPGATLDQNKHPVPTLCSPAVPAAVAEAGGTGDRLTSRTPATADRRAGQPVTHRLRP